MRVVTIGVFEIEAEECVVRRWRFQGEIVWQPPEELPESRRLRSTLDRLGLEWRSGRERE